MIYSYSFTERVRDLSDVLSTVVKDQPRFISLFPRVEDAYAPKHEWLEDQIAGRSVTATAVNGLVLTVSAADAAKVAVGTLLNVVNDSAVFRVTSISGTSVTVALAAANGSTTIEPSANDVLNIISTPIVQGSTAGENTFWQSGSAYNCTQIFRKDIVLTGTALATAVYGQRTADDKLNRQTAYAMDQLARDLNRVALFGPRVEVSGGNIGSAGGLYFFGTQDGGLSVSASGARLDSYLVNDAAQAVMGAGGDPLNILVGPGQARVLSGEYGDKLNIVRADTERGAYVATIANAINGRGMTIISDPDVPDTDAWVIDPAGFGISYLVGRELRDRDTTPPTFDGIQRTAEGELTLTFKNAKQRLCRISGLQASATAIAAQKSAKTVVIVGNTVGNPVPTQEISGGTPSA